MLTATAPAAAPAAPIPRQAHRDPLRIVKHLPGIGLQLPVPQLSDGGLPLAEGKPWVGEEDRVVRLSRFLAVASEQRGWGHRAAWLLSIGFGGLPQRATNKQEATGNTQASPGGGWGMPRFQGGTHNMGPMGL